jgi:hypothetical protein
VVELSILATAKKLSLSKFKTNPLEAENRENTDTEPKTHTNIIHPELGLMNLL